MLEPTSLGSQHELYKQTVFQYFPGDSSTRLGLQRHPVLCSEQLPETWPFCQGTDIVGLFEKQPVIHSNHKHTHTHRHAEVHSISFVPLENPD